METFPIGREAASPALQCAGPRAHCGREGLGTCACAHHSDAQTGWLRLARAEGSFSGSSFGSASAVLGSASQQRAIRVRKTSLF